MTTKIVKKPNGKIETTQVEVLQIVWDTIEGRLHIELTNGDCFDSSEFCFVQNKERF